MDVSSPTFQELKRDALVLRANKLIEWLHRPEYNVYNGHESTVQLIKVTDLIIWALERSIPLGEWRPFEEGLRNCRFILTDTFDTEVSEKETYRTAREETIVTLRSYLEFIGTKDIEVVYSE